MKRTDPSRRNFIKNSISLFAALLLGSLSGCRDRGEITAKDHSNPYEYDIERYKKISPESFIYQETAPLNISFDDIKGLSLNKSGMLAVAGRKGIEILINNKKRGVFKTDDEISAVELNDNNDLYVAFRDRIKLYTIDGTLKKEVINLGEKAYVTSMSFSDGKLAAADFGSKLIWLVDASGRLIDMIKSVASDGHKEDFRLPSPYFDISFDSGGYLWVTNPGRHKLVKLTENGKKISEWGVASMELNGFSGCCNPTHFTITESGTFITAEKGIVRIKEYSSSGKFIGVVAGPASFKEGTTGLLLASSGNSSVYIADRDNNQIRVFIKK